MGWLSKAIGWAINPIGSAIESTTGIPSTVPSLGDAAGLGGSSGGSTSAPAGIGSGASASNGGSSGANSIPHLKSIPTVKDLRG